MKAIAKIKDILTDNQGRCVASFTIDDLSQANLIKSLQSDKTYALDIKEVRPARSLEQNSLFWKLCHEIGVAMNGRTVDDMETYIMLLKKANAKCEYVGCLREALPTLQEQFRACEVVKDIDLNGKPGVMVRVYIGGSKMNTKEFSQLIDTALDVASQLNLDVLYWRELLKG